MLPVDIGILLGFELFPRCLLPLAHRRPRTIFAVETVECLVVRCFSVVDTMLLFGNECLKEFRVARDPCRFVGMLARREVLDRLGAIVQCAEQFTDEPDLVAFRVVAPGAAQNDELDFVGDVPHFGEGFKACGNLQVGIEEGAFGALACRLICQVAFGHAQVVGAVQAVAGALPRLGEHGDGSNA